MTLWLITAHELNADIPIKYKYIQLETTQTHFTFLLLELILSFLALRNKWHFAESTSSRVS